MRHEEAAAHGLNHRWRHEDAADHSTLALNKSVDVHTLDDHPGGLAHQSRELARCFGKSPRNLMPGSETVWANGLGQR